jgi:hypothetical protein
MSGHDNSGNASGKAALNQLISNGEGGTTRSNPHITLTDTDQLNIRAFAKEHGFALRTSEMMYRSFGQDPKQPLRVLKEQIETQVKPAINSYQKTLDGLKEIERGFFTSSILRSKSQHVALNAAMSDFIDIRNRSGTKSLSKGAQDTVDLATASELMRHLKGQNVDPTDHMRAYGLLTPLPPAEYQVPPNDLSRLKSFYDQTVTQKLAENTSIASAEAEALDATRILLRDYIAKENENRALDMRQPLDGNKAAMELMNVLNIPSELPTSFVDRSETIGRGGYVRNRVLEPTWEDVFPAHMNIPYRTPDKTTVFVLSDFHGHVDGLEKMASNFRSYRQQALGADPDKKFVWVQTGDTIDKERSAVEGSAHTVDALLKLRQEYPQDTFEFLPGNHEFEWMIPFLKGTASDKKIHNWLTVRGGAKALQSWEELAKQRGDFTFDLSGFNLIDPPRNNPGWYQRLSSYVSSRMPPEHARYFMDLEDKTHVEIGDYRFIHAGFDPAAMKPFASKRAKRHVWDRDYVTNILAGKEQTSLGDGKITVVGHTIVGKPTIIDDDNGNPLLMLDTGAASNKGFSGAILDGNEISILTTSLDGNKNYSTVPEPHRVYLGDGPVTVLDSSGNLVANDELGGVDNFLRGRITNPLWRMSDTQKQRLSEFEPNEHFVAMAGDDMIVQRPDISGQQKLIALDRKGQTTPLNLMKETPWTPEEITPELVRNARPISYPINPYQTPSWFMPPSP